MQRRTGDRQPPTRRSPWRAGRGGGSLIWRRQSAFGYRARPRRSERRLQLPPAEHPDRPWLPRFGHRYVRSHPLPSRHVMADRRSSLVHARFDQIPSVSVEVFGDRQHAIWFMARRFDKTDALLRVRGGHGQSRLFRETGTRDRRFDRRSPHVAGRQQLALVTVRSPHHAARPPPPLVIRQRDIFRDFEAKLLDEEEERGSYSSTRRAVRFTR